MSTAVASSGYPAMFELTGLIMLAAPVVKVTAANASAATRPAVRPSWRNTAQTDVIRQVATMATETSDIPSQPPSTRTGTARR
jgi:hypothetical protein